MPPFLQKKLILDFIEKAPAAAVILIAIVVLAVYIAVKADRKNKADAKERKQQHKCEMIVRRLPCLDERQREWLIDPEQNGGEPPGSFACPNMKNTSTKS